MGGKRQEGASAAEADAEGSDADEKHAHVARKMAGEYPGEEGNGNDVHQGGDALDEASCCAVSWGLESMDNGGGAEATGDEEDRKTDAASKRIVCGGLVAAKSARLAAEASGGEKEAEYHVTGREADG